jgi:hypothetical protein
MRPDQLERELQERLDAFPPAARAEDDPDLAALHVQAGFDTRESGTSWIFARMTPLRIQAWREENELEGRDVMRDGAWLE